MSIKHTVDGRGRDRYRVYVNDKARKKAVYVGTFDRRTDAQEAEYEARKRLKMGEAAKPKPAREEITFEALGKRWLASRQNIRRSTRIDYEQSLRRLRPHFGKKLVSEISRRDVDAAVAALAVRYAPSTCRKAMITFSMVMKTGLAWQHLDTLPTYGQRLALPKIRKRHFEPLKPDQVARLVDAAPEYWRPAILVLFTVAPRRAELFGITNDCVDLDAGTIWIRKQLQRGRLVDPKSETSVRKVTMPTVTVEAIRAHLAVVPPSEMNLLFPTENGRPVDANNWFHRVWMPTREAAGLPHLRVHDARHHLATLLLSQGRSVKLVQSILGHSTAAILLDIYTSVTKQEEDVAASELDRWMGEEERAIYSSPSTMEVTDGAVRVGCQMLAA